MGVLVQRWDATTEEIELVAQHSVGEARADANDEQTLHVLTGYLMA